MGWCQFKKWWEASAFDWVFEGLEKVQSFVIELVEKPVEKAGEIRPVLGAFAKIVQCPVLLILGIAFICLAICGAIFAFCIDMVKMFWFLPFVVVGYLFVLAYFRCALVVVAMEFLKRMLF